MDQATLEIVKMVVPFGTAAFGAFCGFGFSQWITSRTRQRLLRNAWGQIFAELRMNRDIADGYGPARVLAPLYRMETTAYDGHFGTLVAEGGLESHDLDKIARVYAKVKEFNRGMDLATGAVAEGNDSRAHGEFSRNVLKAEHLGRGAQRASLMDDAIATLGYKLGMAETK